MWAKGSAFLIWAAVAATSVFWVLRLFGAPVQAPTHAQPAPVATVMRADLTRVLGAEPVAVAPAAAVAPPAADQGRFQLLGVIAPSGAGASGWATLSVDGKPPRTYRVGQLIDGTRILQKVSARGVDIGLRGAEPVVSLPLSALPPAATGKTAGAAGPAAPAGPRPPAPWAPGQGMASPGAQGVAAPAVTPSVHGLAAPVSAAEAAPEAVPEAGGTAASGLRRPGVVTR